MAELDESVVEAIMRWYVTGGGQDVTITRVLFGPRAVRSCLYVPPGNPAPDLTAELARVARILAECPHRVAAGNPFRPWVTITMVERSVIAEIEYEHFARQAAALQMMQGVTNWQQTVEAVEWRDLWHRMEVLYRGHPTWAPGMAWLQRAFGEMVFGDPARGVCGNVTLLGYIGVGLDNSVMPR